MQLCRGEAARSEMRVRHRKEGERTQWPPTRYVPLLSVRECQGQPHSEPTVATVLDYVSRCLISLRREELPASIDFFPFFYFILSFFLRNLEETTMQAFQTEIDFPSKGKRRRIRFFSNIWGTKISSIFIIFVSYIIVIMTIRSRVYKLRRCYRLCSGLIFGRARNRWSFRCSFLLKIIFHCAPALGPETLPALSSNMQRCPYRNVWSRTFIFLRLTLWNNVDRLIKIPCLF